MSSEYPLNTILQKIINKDPEVLRLWRIQDKRLLYNSQLDDNKVIKLAEPTQRASSGSFLNYEYKNLWGDEMYSVKFTHEIIIVDCWDKNAVYYLLDKAHFPNAKVIIMNSHPCEYSTLTRSNRWNWLWICLNNHRWYRDFSENCVKVLNDEQRKMVMEAIDKVKPYTTDINDRIVKRLENF